MPELPEVELTLRILKPLMVEQRLIDFWVDEVRGLRASISPEKISNKVKGLKVRELRRHGKVLFIDLSSSANLSFALHLKMSGALLWGSPGVLSSRAKRKHVHFIWRFGNGNELWFRDPRKFGIVWYGTKKELAKDGYLDSLGSDAASVSLSIFRKLINRHSGKLKSLLLRQNVIAGLGNITVDESLWEAGIYPSRIAGDLSPREIQCLYHAVEKILRRAIKTGGNTMRDWIMPDGRKGGAVLYWRVYHKEGESCLRCGHAIRRIVVGGRSTHFCPYCQRS